MIRLLVGLGNPGPDYAATRHNAGFWWLQAVADKLGARLVPERSYFGLAARLSRPQGPLWLLMPQTFMNLSGKSVASLARFFKIAPDEILVAHDELDLLPGQLKLKQGGSHAGHNGLKDIDGQLGSRDYWRLRIGVGHPGVRAEVIDWVLKKPSPEHREAIAQCIERSIGSLDLLIDGPMERAMMNLHAKPPRPKPPAPAVTAASARIPAAIKEAGGSDAQSTAKAAGAGSAPAADHVGRDAGPGVGDRDAGHDTGSSG
jgi:peptidyl-tRNA hydrolase, PTH1 family